MISYIKGTIHHIDHDAAVVLSGGVGYAVFVPRRVLDGLLLETEVELYTYQHVRENALELFGFTDRPGLNLFRQLTGVAGVGPKLALAVLSDMQPEDIKRAIIHKDTAALTAISGVGKKTAERIVLDLQERVTVDGPGVAAAGESRGDQLSTVDALLSLGYSKPEALSALEHIDSGATLEEQVRTALQYLSSS